LDLDSSVGNLITSPFGKCCYMVEHNNGFLGCGVGDNQAGTEDLSNATIKRFMKVHREMVIQMLERHHDELLAIMASTGQTQHPRTDMHLADGSDVMKVELETELPCTTQLSSASKITDSCGIASMGSEMSSLKRHVKLFPPVNLGETEESETMDDGASQEEGTTVKEQNREHNWNFDSQFEVFFCCSHSDQCMHHGSSTAVSRDVNWT